MYISSWSILAFPLCSSEILYSTFFYSVYELARINLTTADLYSHNYYLISIIAFQNKNRYLPENRVNYIWAMLFNTTTVQIDNMTNTRHESSSDKSYMSINRETL